MHGNQLTILAPVSIETVRTENREYMRQHIVQVPTQEQIDAVKIAEYRQKYALGEA